ncbi:hypothetical protein [Amycolatopsis rifamycinica]|uniref:Uncharacterized protein n=1 Tax=Amycolatopsis rifamycinica TaxID=287986 RepID=A0A066U830_9PSEU|nr:hypothetical protein [Amycolatopsis rifamycinica]KDN23220.1 hypothetical protein DV20_05745 [Amycolatopsis rifamycinica]
MSIHANAEQIVALAHAIPLGALQAAGQEMDAYSDRVHQLVGSTPGGQRVVAALQQSHSAYESLIRLWTQAQIDLLDLARHHMNDG